MSFTAQVLKVFIASPGDVPGERAAVREIVADWNAVHAEERNTVLLPVGWETHSAPQMGDRAQAIINKQVLKNCDLLVAVFWTRIGTRTTSAASGTVEEIEEHLKAGKPAMIYFSGTPVKLDSVDAKQYDALQKFKKECRERGLIESYESSSEFREKLTRQLAQTIIREYPAADQPSTALRPTRSEPPLSDEARELLSAAVADPTGNIHRIQSDGGIGVMSNGRTFSEFMNPRSTAKWESAIRELEAAKLIEQDDFERNTFAVTHRGYSVAGELGTPPQSPDARETE